MEFSTTHLQHGGGVGWFFNVHIIHTKTIISCFMSHLTVVTGQNLTKPNHKPNVTQLIFHTDKHKI